MFLTLHFSFLSLGPFQTETSQKPFQKIMRDECHHSGETIIYIILTYIGVVSCIYEI